MNLLKKMALGLILASVSHGASLLASEILETCTLVSADQTGTSIQKIATIEVKQTATQVEITVKKLSSNKRQLFKVIQEELITKEENPQAISDAQVSAQDLSELGITVDAKSIAQIRNLLAQSVTGSEQMILQIFSTQEKKFVLGGLLMGGTGLPCIQE